MANCVQCGRTLPPFSFGKKICQWCVQHEAAQRGELPEDAPQPVMAAPWQRYQSSSMLLTQIFAGICAAVFVGMAASGVSITNPTSQQLIQWGANFGPLTLGGEWWRLITCVFIHIGIIHIALNMWCLWSLGQLAEPLYGHTTFAAVYVICGLGASLTSVWWRPEGVSAGASGAIFGLAGALIASLRLGEFSLPRSAVQGTLRSVVTFAIYNLIFGAVSGRIDNAAHIGGLVTGLILGALIARVAPQPDQPVRRFIVVILILIPLLAAGLWLHRSRAYMAHMQRGAELIEEDRTDEAIVELEKALRLKPDYVPAHAELAHAYWDKKQFDKAEVSLKRVLELDPKDMWNHYRLGALYMEQSRTHEAKAAFGQMLSLNPDNPYAHLGLGWALAAEDSHQEAVKEYKTARRLKPDMAGVNYEIGRSLAALKRYDEAIEAFQQEQKLSGDTAETQAALAEAYRAQGMDDEAERAPKGAQEFKKP